MRVHAGLWLCTALLLAHYACPAIGDEPTPQLRSDSGSEVAGGEPDGGAPRLRDEDGDPNVGGRTRDTTCPVIDDQTAAPKLRGADDKQDGQAKSTEGNAKQARAEREQAAAVAAAKARQAAEQAVALARPKNGSVVFVDTSEFVADNAEVLVGRIKQALGGGKGELAVLKESILSFLGGQWVNSMVPCEVHEFANGTITKIPCAVQNYTAVFGQIYEKATMEGDAQSQYWLGRMFESGCALGDDDDNIVDVDVNQAAQLYMAAGPEVAEANRALGQLLEAHGDVDTAAQLYSKALEMGDVRALALLGQLYEEHGDLEQAVDLYTQGANLKETLAMTCAAEVLQQGRGVAKDAGKALDLLVYAAAHLESSAFALLAHALEEGLAVAKSAEAAAGLYDIAANLGHAGAAAQLARLYASGLGVQADSDQALKWAKQAAAGGIEWKDEWQAGRAREEYAQLKGKAALLGGRPSRYQYLTIPSHPLSAEEKAAQDAVGFTGTVPTPGIGETARYTYLAAQDYLKMPSVLWDAADGSLPT